MGSRVRRGAATGPAQWLLVFLQARDIPPRAHLGMAVGPAEWLLVFLDGARMDVTRHWAVPETGSVHDFERGPARLSALQDVPDTGHVFTRRYAAQGI